MSKQLQFFADIINVSIKSDVSSMEHPLFALSKRQDHQTFKYENPNTGVWVEVTPSVAGRATIYDKDLLLYVIGQLAEGRNRKRVLSRNVRITAYDYFLSTNRGSGGTNYKDLFKTLVRLRGTTFKTNWQKKGTSQAHAKIFGFIDSADVVRDEKTGRMLYVDVTISEHLFDAIVNGKILTYHPDYFKLNASERRMYELVRKHCGTQPEWKIGVDLLHTKFGSRCGVREFRRVIKGMVGSQRLPGYHIGLSEEGRNLVASQAETLSP